jgi:hypothetical protein
VAVLIREDGTQQDYALPMEGAATDRLRQVQEVLKGYIEAAWLGDGRVLLANEDGLSLEFPDNEVASALLGRRLVGAVLICSEHEVLAWDAL